MKLTNEQIKETVQTMSIAEAHKVKLLREAIELNSTTARFLIAAHWKEQQNGGSLPVTIGDQRYVMVNGKYEGKRT
jgi:hypothetical protein